MPRPPPNYTAHRLGRWDRLPRSSSGSTCKCRGSSAEQRGRRRFATQRLRRRPEGSGPRRSARPLSYWRPQPPLSPVPEPRRPWRSRASTNPPSPAFAARSRAHPVPSAKDRCPFASPSGGIRENRCGRFERPRAGKVPPSIPAGMKAPLRLRRAHRAGGIPASKSRRSNGMRAPTKRMDPSRRSFQEVEIIHARNARDQDTGLEAERVGDPGDATRLPFLEVDARARQPPSASPRFRALADRAGLPNGRRVADLMDVAPPQ